MDGVGLTARRKTIGMPFEMPPSMPPQWFVSVTILPFSARYASLFSLPRRPAAAKPRPNAMPLTAGMAKMSWLILFSNPRTSVPRARQGTPVIWQRMGPPTGLLPHALVQSRPSCVRQIRRLSRGGPSGRPAREIPDVSSIPAIASMRAMTSMPRAASSCLQMPPAMHKGRSAGRRSVRRRQRPDSRRILPARYSRRDPGGGMSMRLR